jgi:hypothetical protein
MVVASAATVFAGLSLSAMAQDTRNQQETAPGAAQSGRPAAQPTRPGAQPNRAPVQPNRPSAQVNRPGAPVPGPAAPGRAAAGPQVQNRVAVGGQGYRFGRPGVRREMHTFNERERFVWGHGLWRHERHYGRDGWWWIVNGAWYWYPERLDGPPGYVSEYEYVDMGPDAGPDVDDYPPGAGPVAGGYPPPPPDAAYPPPPPPPPPPSETLGGALGGAIIGGVLGGALTGRAGGAAAGAIIGGATGAAIGADAERRRNGYYWWHGACYYRYPSGEYAAVPPGYCAY